MPTIVVMLQYGNDRTPVDFEMVRRKEDPRNRPEPRRLRWMLVSCQRPSWAEMVVVVADAAFATAANLQLIQRRGSFVVMALARTRRFEDEHTL